MGTWIVTFRVTGILTAVFSVGIPCGCFGADVHLGGEEAPCVQERIWKRISKGKEGNVPFHCIASLWAVNSGRMLFPAIVIPE